MVTHLTAVCAEEVPSTVRLERDHLALQRALKPLPAGTLHSPDDADCTCCESGTAHLEQVRMRARSMATDSDDGNRATNGNNCDNSSCCNNEDDNDASKGKTSHADAAVDATGLVLWALHQQ